MAKQFRDRDGNLWIADYFGSSSSGDVHFGEEIGPGRMDLDQLLLERLNGSKKLLATMPRGRWPDVSEEELRDALEQALIVDEQGRDS